MTKLDRNINGTGRGKYGLIKTRVLNEYLEILPKGLTRLAHNDVEVEAMKIANAINFLEAMGIIEWGEPGTEGEFFVIKLRDEHAHAALDSYAFDCSVTGDHEYSDEVQALANRAGLHSPFCKKPD